MALPQIEAMMTHQSRGLLSIRVIKSIATSPNSRVNNYICSCTLLFDNVQIRLERNRAVITL